jgi:cell fate regulator YaaT (PSP1 superfamily)
MKIVKVQFYPWENILHEFSSGNYDLKVGDKVIARNELGLEMGKVKSVEEPRDMTGGENEQIKKISRKATNTDEEKVEELCEGKKSAKKYCKEIVKNLNLPMKVVDVFFSLDGSHVIFSFIAETRVDFRELVRILTGHFQKTIRMQQIGIRDEAKTVGGVGVCGRELCCRKVLKVLVNIRSDLVKLQQLENKASDRLSGACGRLVCCLAYEQKTYEACSKGIPQVGERVSFEGKTGVVIKRYILKRTVRVKDKEGLIVEVEVDKLKK